MKTPMDYSCTYCGVGVGEPCKVDWMNPYTYTPDKRVHWRRLALWAAEEGRMDELLWRDDRETPNERYIRCNALSGLTGVPIETSNVFISVEM